MKKLFTGLCLLVIFGLMLAACTPSAQSKAVQLPDPLVQVVGMLVMVGLTTLAKWVLEKTGIDISNRAAEIASALAAIVVLAINYGLGLIPGQFDNILSGLFAFLVVFLGGAGFYSLVLRTKER